MASPRGIFDETLNNATTSDTSAVAEGWFDNDVISQAQIDAVDGASAGTGDSAGITAAIWDGVFSSAGVGASSAAGSALWDGVGSAAGVAANSVVGVAIWDGVFSANGLAGSSVISAALFLGAGSSAGIAAITGSTAFLILSVGSSVGIATAQSDSVLLLPGVFVSSATGDATGVTIILNVGAFSALGQSTVAGDGDFEFAGSTFVVVCSATGEAIGNLIVGATAIASARSTGSAQADSLKFFRRENPPARGWRGGVFSGEPGGIPLFRLHVRNPIGNTFSSGSVTTTKLPDVAAEPNVALPPVQTAALPKPGYKLRVKK